ncbi:MAG: hypothetical protein LN413_05725 [Candidatus Thermoplasmatota archaeon]|nr:hypothetical protein [Candidatus Thermoplasmatota archaeon]
MVEFDPLWIGILVAILGLIMWAVTNIRLTRTGRDIKADIDEKRAATEEFVRGQLGDLRTGLQEDLPKVDLEPQLDALKATFKSDLQELESRLETVQIDARPIMDQVEAKLIPAVQERVEALKSTLLGKMGYAVKGVKALGEGVAELAGERVLAESGVEAEWQMRLAEYGLDEAWLKTHKTAAFGLSLLKEALGRGEDVQIVGSVPQNAKQLGPPKGFK